jgi:ADP-heptose:LPS heptosyltransferase
LTETDRILVYRCGSLGDTIVALPCFHLIRRTFPDAAIRVMTDTPNGRRALALEAILDGSGLVDEIVAHRRGLRHPLRLAALVREVRQWRPDAVVCLPAFPTRLKVVSDALFFRLCGVSKQIGVPWSRALRTHRFDSTHRLYESEASRLARCLAPLGTAAFDAADLSLNHTPEETQRAAEVLSQWSGRRAFIAICVGTKVLANDWGDANWRMVLRELGRIRPDIGLMMFGGGDDRARADRLLADWPGPRLNLCAEIEPRVSALLMRDALLYMGHDSGPMHLAASVGTPCVCVFSRHNLPGWWFPLGRGHQPLYPWRRDGKIKAEEAGIDEIMPADVIVAASQVLRGRSQVGGGWVPDRKVASSGG